MPAVVCSSQFWSSVSGRRVLAYLKLASCLLRRCSGCRVGTFNKTRNWSNPCVVFPVPASQVQRCDKDEVQSVPIFVCGFCGVVIGQTLVVRPFSDSTPRSVMHV